MFNLWQLPKHIDEETILTAISIEKDVDGFHPFNIGRLCMKVYVGSVSTHTPAAAVLWHHLLQCPVLGAPHVIYSHHRYEGNFTASHMYMQHHHTALKTRENSRESQPLLANIML